MAKREKKWGNFKVETELPIALDNGVSEIRELADEMDNWRSSLQGTNLENSEKFSSIEEAADTLSSAADNLESISLPNILDAKKVEFWEERQRTLSRSRRLSNAINALQAVQNELQEFLDNYESKSTKEGPEYSPEAIESIEEAKDAVENAISEVEGVDFPGMY